MIPMRQVHYTVHLRDDRSRESYISEIEVGTDVHPSDVWKVVCKRLQVIRRISGLIPYHVERVTVAPITVTFSA